MNSPCYISIYVGLDDNKFIAFINVILRDCSQNSFLLWKHIHSVKWYWMFCSDRLKKWTLWLDDVGKTMSWHMNSSSSSFSLKSFIISLLIDTFSIVLELLVMYPTSLFHIINEIIIWHSNTIIWQSNIKYLPPQYENKVGCGSQMEVMTNVCSS